MLTTGEMWPSQRVLPTADEPVPGEAVMEGVEHLGSFVYEMTNTKVKQMQAEDAMPLEGIQEENEEDERLSNEGGDEDLEPDIQEVREE